METIETHLILITFFEICKNTHSEYVRLTAFSPPQRLHKWAAMLRYITGAVLGNLDRRAVLHHEKLHILHFSPAFMEITK
jgi:hypothetical protein